MTTRVLVAGVGNIFLSDDAFDHSGPYTHMGLAVGGGATDFERSSAVDSAPSSTHRYSVST